MKAHVAAMAFCLVLLMGAGLAPSTLEDSHNAHQSAQSSDGGSTNTSNWTYYNYTSSVVGLADQVAAKGFMTIPVGPNNSLELALTQVSRFKPGHDKVRYYAEDGSYIDQPYPGRFFSGAVVGSPLSRVDIQISDAGIAGLIKCPDVRISVDRGLLPGHSINASSVKTIVGRQPTSSATPVGGLGWKPCLTPCDPTSPGCGYSPPEVRKSSQRDAENRTEQIANEANPSSGALFVLTVKPWTELAYRDYADDFAERISDAIYYGEASEMWIGETDIEVESEFISVRPTGFGQASCGASSGDMGLDAFTGWLTGPARALQTPGPNAWMWFDVSNNPNAPPYSGSGTAGCAVAQHLSERHSISDDEAFASVEAKDWSAGDSYNPGASRHLGFAAHHELSHLAGATTHPTDSRWGQWNLMHNGWPGYHYKGYWRTAHAQTEIETYAHPILVL